MSKGENLRTLEAEVKQAAKGITFSIPEYFEEQSNHIKPVFAFLNTGSAKIDCIIV